ncbi:MAG TPA: TIGR01777 family oxidoreductase [Thermoanaerobaculia bacterium]|nr:TIGR01777 family oxidoreductase [Thermoanaerobaculia bacterium]
MTGSERGGEHSSRGRVIVTGGTGLIGRPLVAALAAAGHEVVVLSRAPVRASGLPAGARAEAWDAATPAGWGDLADGALAIVHLAGESLARWPWTAARKERILASRVRSTRAVAAAIAAAARPPAALLQASGISVYGDAGDRVLDETAPPGEGFLPEVVLAWEGASAGVEERGVRRVLLRTGVVLAAHGGALPKMALPFRLFAGGPVGGGGQWLPWIHLADQVAAVRYLLDHPAAAGVFHLTAPSPVTNAELSRRLADALGRPGFVRVPAAAARLALGEMSVTVLASVRAVPARLAALGFRFRFPTLESALADLYGRRSPTPSRR